MSNTTFAIGGNTGLRVPFGNTVQRPADSNIGHIRYNIDINNFEGFVYPNGWITIISNNNPNILYAANGTVSAPSISFGAQTDSGLYLINTDDIGIAVGGTLAINISSNFLTVKSGMNVQGALTVVASTLTVGSTVNIGSKVIANASPLQNNLTLAFTGLSANLTANAQTNSNLAQTNVLSCTLNEKGMYRMEGMLHLGTTSGAQASNASVGMNLSIGTGTATVASIKYTVQGRANGTTIVSNLITTTAQTLVISNSSQSIANSTNNTDYLAITGFINVSATGTINLQVASANSANSNLNVASNSYIIYTKIG